MMGLQTVELLVRLDCTGCEMKVRKHISKLGGKNRGEFMGMD
jgi:hypothetical protein